MTLTAKEQVCLDRSRTKLFQDFNSDKKIDLVFKKNNASQKIFSIFIVFLQTLLKLQLEPMFDQVLPHLVLFCANLQV